MAPPSDPVIEPEEPSGDDLDAFDYALPADAIAQQPLAERDASRLLVDLGRGVEHRHTRDLPDLLGPGDVLVLNDTKVLPARLKLRKPTGGAVEVLMLEPAPAEPADGAGHAWTALVRPGRRVPSGARLDTGAGLVVVVGEAMGDGTRRVVLHHDETLETVLDRLGELPLPPYITERPADPSRYQTVYARAPGSAAAPTAGLHLTEVVLDRCRAREVDVRTVELVVGLDTFRPVTARRLDDHVMHTERYLVPEATWAAVQAAERVVAVGTTVVRALESAAARGELEGRTDLFIRRPYPWAVVDVLLTNFHLPRSTLLVLLDAFVGPRWRDLYTLALDEGYRFLSFGDAMLVARRRHDDGLAAGR